MDEFNFFGTRGKLKNVREMIIEKAEELKRRDEGKKEFAEITERLEKQKKDYELLQQ